MKEITICYNKRKMFFKFSLFFLMFLVGLLFLSIDILPHAFYFLKYTTFLLFIFSFFYGIEIFSDKKVFRLTKEGFFDSYSILSIPKLEWDEIEKIELHPVAHHNFIEIKLKDVSKSAKHIKNPILRGLFKVNIFLRFPPVLLSFEETNVKAKEALKILTEYLEASKK